MSSYKSHLHRKHKDVDLKIHANEEPNNQEQHENQDQNGLDEEPIGDERDCEGDRIEKQRRTNALYLLKTKECNLLTQKATNDIVEGSTWLVRNTVEIIQQGLQNRLDSAGIAFEAVPGLNELFAEDNPISNPFSHVATKHKQGNYFKQVFGLVVSNNDSNNYW